MDLGVSPIQASPTTSAVVQALAPSMVGWMLQAVISGACFQTSARLLSARPSGLDRKTRSFLYTMLLLNISVLVLTFYENVYWGTLQKVTYNSMYTFTYPDALVVIPSTLLIVLVQIFFAVRAWHFVGKSVLFFIYTLVCITAGLSGGLAMSAFALISIERGASVTRWPAFFIANELMLWAPVCTELAVTTALVVGLSRRKKALLRSTSRRATEYLYTRLMVLAIQSTAVTSVAVVATAVMQVAARNTPLSNLFYSLQCTLPAMYFYSYLWCLDGLQAAQRNISTDAQGMGGIADPNNRMSLVKPTMEQHIVMPVLNRRDTDKSRAGDSYVMTYQMSGSLYDFGDLLSSPVLSIAEVMSGGQGQQLIQKALDSDPSSPRITIATPRIDEPEPAPPSPRSPAISRSSHKTGPPRSCSNCGHDGAQTGGSSEMLQVPFTMASVHADGGSPRLPSSPRVADQDLRHRDSQMTFV